MPEIQPEPRVSVVLPVRVWGMTAQGRPFHQQARARNIYLLDTNVKENSPEDRKVTGALYSGNQELRLQQEIVLGIGGMRVLRALGIRPTVCHMKRGPFGFPGA